MMLIVCALAGGVIGWFAARRHVLDRKRELDKLSQASEEWQDVPAKLVVDREAAEQLADRIANPRKPTQAMQDLFPRVEVNWSGIASFVGKPVDRVRALELPPTVSAPPNNQGHHPPWQPCGTYAELTFDGLTYEKCPNCPPEPRPAAILSRASRSGVRLYRLVNGNRRTRSSRKDQSQEVSQEGKVLMTLRPHDTELAYAGLTFFLVLLVAQGVL